MKLQDLLNTCNKQIPSLEPYLHGHRIPRNKEFKLCENGEYREIMTIKEGDRKKEIIEIGNIPFENRVIQHTAELQNTAKAESVRSFVYYLSSKHILNNSYETCFIMFLLFIEYRKFFHIQLSNYTGSESVLTAYRTLAQAYFQYFFDTDGNHTTGSSLTLSRNNLKKFVNGLLDELLSHPNLKELIEILNKSGDPLEYINEKINNNESSDSNNKIDEKPYSRMLLALYGLKALFLFLNAKIDGVFVQRIIFNDIDEKQMQADDKIGPQILLLKNYIIKDAINLDTGDDIYLPPLPVCLRQGGIDKQALASSPFLGLRIMLIGVIILILGRVWDYREGTSR